MRQSRMSHKIESLETQEDRLSENSIAKAVAMTCCLALLVSGCGGGGGKNDQGATTGSQPQPPSPAMVAPAEIQSYTCDSASSPSRCDTDLYPFKWAMSIAQLTQTLTSTYNDVIAKNAALMACKPQVACQTSWGTGLPTSLADAMRQASTAVVKVSLTTDHVRSYYNALGLSNTCTGTVVRNTLDSTVYILTAGHCLFDAPLYPNVNSGSYKNLGLPVYVTFFFQKEGCSNQINLAGSGDQTLPAIVVGWNYSQNGLSAPDWHTISGGTIDFAMLRLAAPLPAGVTPIPVRARSLAPTDQLFTFSHPLGLDKVGGVIDKGADFAGSTPFQYQVFASRRLTEPGSSGGPLFAYDGASNTVSLIGVQSGASVPTGANAEVCLSSQGLSYARLDDHRVFLQSYIGPM